MYGFVSPDGQFHECEYGGHIMLALELLKAFYGLSSNNPVDLLCSHGWIAVQASFVGFAGDDIRHSPSITAAQRQWIEENEGELSHDQRISLAMCLEADELLYA